MCVFMCVKEGGERWKRDVYARETRCVCVCGLCMCEWVVSNV